MHLKVHKFKSLTKGMCECSLGAVELLTVASPRFRQVPTFGNGTIRRFGDNVSGLKKMAARDYEDILQVSGLDIVSNPF